MKYQFTGEASYDLPVGKGRAHEFERRGRCDSRRMDGECDCLSQHRHSHRLAGGRGRDSPISISGPIITCDPASGAPHTATTWFNSTASRFPASPFVRRQRAGLSRSRSHHGSAGFRYLSLQELHNGRGERSAIGDFFLQPRQPGAAWHAGHTKHHRGSNEFVTSRSVRTDHGNRESASPIPIRREVHVLTRSMVFQAVKEETSV